MTNQTSIIKVLGTQPQIDTKTEVNRRSKFLEDSLISNGGRGLVLGLSGGADSTLTAYIARLAIDNLNTLFPNEKYTLHALILPEKSRDFDTDVEDALKVAANYVTFNNLYKITVGEAKNAVIHEYDIKEMIFNKSNIDTLNQHELNDIAKGNISSRLRMVQLYNHAATHHLRVLGTDNAAEQVTGFYTKYGDGGYDLNPLQTLTKRQVFQILRETNAPSSILTKSPAANLSNEYPGRTDEEELGLSYGDIDDFLEGKQIDLEVEKKIIERYDFTQHKREMPTFI